MKILAITQARYGSTRLPAKILKEVNGMTLLEIHLRRILQSRLVSKLKVATTDEDGAKYIVDVANKLGVDSYRGSVNDVLDRFYQTAISEKPDYVVRVTSDCPLIDPSIIDLVVKTCIDSDYDYVSNVLEPTYPDGMDVEVFKFQSLEKAWREATLKSDREHVTPYIWRNSSVKGGVLFKSYNVSSSVDNSKLRITVDTPDDFEVVKSLVENLGIERKCDEYVSFLNSHRDIGKMNQQYSRNEGYEKSLKEDKNIK